MRWLAGFGALAVTTSFAPAVTAQRVVGEEEGRRNVPQYDAMKAAAARGREMYLYDQAAWHATDRLREELDLDNAAFMRGYIVLPRDDGRLDAVFYGEADGMLVEVARYTVAGSRVEEGGVLPENARPPLSELAVRMADARQIAAEEMRLRDYRLCANSSANTIVLPPVNDGSITVYVLTPPTSSESYPMGGHYRIKVGSDGTVHDSRRFMNTCFDAALGQIGRRGNEREGTPQAMVLSHLLDPGPTEIHVFASYYIPITLMIVTTENQQMWSIRQGSVGYIGPASQQR